MNENNALILKCLECTAEFRINSIDLGTSGRRVQCMECTHIWFQDPISIQNDSEPLNNIIDAIEKKISQGKEPTFLESSRCQEYETDIEEENIYEQQNFKKTLNKNNSVFQAPLQKKSSFSHKLLFIFVLISLMLTILFFARNIFTYGFPSVRPLYENLGIPLSHLSKFKWEYTQWSQKMVDNQPTIIVEGEIVNKSTEVATIPTLTVVLKGFGSSCLTPSLFDKIFGSEYHVGSDGSCALVKWQIPFMEKKLLPGQRLPFKSLYKLHKGLEPKQIFLKFID